MSSTQGLWRSSFSTLADARLEVYDDVMVPRMFEPWARRLVDVVAVAPGESVLDVACGPGSVAAVAAARAGSEGRVVGCDLSPTMVELARSKGRAEGAAATEYHHAPAHELPADDGEFDAVTCQHGLQFFPDRLAAVQEMHRVVRPGGRVGITVWTEINNSPPFLALAEAVREVLGPELAARYEAGPFGMTDGGELDAVLTTAGFQTPEISQHVLPVEFEDGPAQLLATLAVTPLADAIEAASDETAQRLVDAVATRTGDGPIRSTLEAHIALAQR